MKKNLICNWLSKILSFIFITIVFLSCNKKNNISAIPNSTSLDIQQIITQQQDTQNIIILPIPTQEVEIETAFIPSQQTLYEQYINDYEPSDTIDLDLSKMSSTMIFSTVFDMLVSPEAYEDKNVKIKGNFVVYVSKETKEKYYSIIVPDATQCCQQGIPFIWFGEKKEYPADFPKIGQEVTLIGKYKSAYTKDNIMTTFIEADKLY